MIEYMGRHISQSVTLNDLARVAALSRFRAATIFRCATGVSPYLFFASLRIENAKRMLLFSRRSVTDTCFDVGYSSLGTFSRIFKQLVGASPAEFRRDAHGYDAASFYSSALEFSSLQARLEGPRFEGEVLEEGTFQHHHDARRIFFVGTFNKAIPMGRPMSGAILLGPGRFRLRVPQRTRFWLLGMSMPLDVFPFAPNPEVVRVGKVEVDSRTSVADLRLSLTIPRVLDPPIVVSLPTLIH